jgi:hypothetical protein
MQSNVTLICLRVKLPKRKREKSAAHLFRVLCISVRACVHVKCASLCVCVSIFSDTQKNAHVHLLVQPALCVVYNFKTNILSLFVAIQPKNA